MTQGESSVIISSKLVSNLSQIYITAQALASEPQAKYCKVEWADPETKYLDQHLVVAKSYNKAFVTLLVSQVPIYIM